MLKDLGSIGRVTRVCAEGGNPDGMGAKEQWFDPATGIKHKFFKPGYTNVTNVADCISNPPP